MKLKLYRWLSHASGPLVDVYLKRRQREGKEDPTRMSERLGHAGFPRPSGPLLWAHAASVGESVSVMQLIEEILEQYSEVNVLITTGTVTSAKMLEGKLPSRVYHQYAPIDRVVTVQRFIEHWQPDMALFVESEIWPNLLTECYEHGCCMIQVNARMSESSFTKWLKHKSMIQRILGYFSLSLAHSEQDMARLESLGARNAKFVGNLKYAAPPLSADPAEAGKLVGMIGERPVWIASSTHPGEEEAILEAHRKIKEHHDKLLTIVIPRHADRADGLLNGIFAELNCAQRSKGEDITSETELYIADTMGELGLFYRLAGVVFVGGSLVEIGGHNPLEPARLECAIVTGPHTANFKDVYDEMEHNQAIVKVQTAEALGEQVDRLLLDDDKQQHLAGAALNLVQSKEGVLEAYMDAMRPFMDALGPLKQADSDEG